MNNILDKMQDPAEPIELTIQRWQKDRNPKDTSKVLTYLKPAIDNAITSFGGGDKTLGVQAAKLALRSMESFDPKQKVDPKTFAYHNLQRLNRLSSDRSSMIHIPESAASVYATVQRGRKDYEDVHGYEPNDDQLADYLSIPVSKINKLEKYNSPMSESATLSEEGDETIGFKMVPDNTYISYLYASSDNIDKKILENTTGYNGKPILQGKILAGKLRMTPAALSQRLSKLRDKMSRLRGLV